VVPSSISRYTILERPGEWCMRQACKEHDIGCSDGVAPKFPSTGLLASPDSMAVTTDILSTGIGLVNVKGSLLSQEDGAE
jgi:hypothetical protein